VPCAFTIIEHTPNITATAKTFQRIAFTSSKLLPNEFSLAESNESLAL
jgi:hypothetical protein